ncbi:lyr family of fe s cluster biogenesis protein [Nannochloropsis gaditana CCMP526]|uniref:Lyr family of fe s cluster biogenesis protein n=1 Tax=Nannochloropsis gaditana (strain CCMP526) TaxID=1093141 RepID=I2CRH0_NANGC|nr:lyr family of fe s cluster biogenesis protein [Nannochloropsis gaditana CCMP526]XP_005855854.1 lyr family of fe s cluster biogenesis protein [Nannochloropsis gaditana CCMP526]EKU20503.1 lyr family of fe s cluster biogenesis protein [Nannochloropsis gaditana CCMP526]EKU20872.1 lyr family of fe s cluster biogenesis protein [Nannochloropsis gaditana CCMP526]|eukprot:XP_005855485.1 lyr family of fe s cluster biogenesis protein [Nannochloropsis gaditana CCMP526]
MSPQRASGLQKEVLSLYRRVLRAARVKDAGKIDGGTYTLARTRFREDATSVSRMDFQKIEFLIRQGHKQLKYLNMPSVLRGASVTPSAASRH